MQWFDRLRNRLASSPVRYGCDGSHPQTHGKLFILQQSQSNFPCPASGGLALLQVCRYMQDLCSYSLTQQAGNSVICTITLILTIMIVSAAPSIRNITAQYAPFSPPCPPRPCPTPNRRVMLLASLQTRALVRQIPSFCSHSHPRLAHLRISLTVTMMSRITLHLRSYRYRSDDVIQSHVVHNRFAGRPFPNVSALEFAQPKCNVRSPPHAAFPPRRRRGSPIVLEDEAFVMDTFSATTTAEAAVDDSSHTRGLSEFEAFVDDDLPRRPTGPDELHV